MVVSLDVYGFIVFFGRVRRDCFEFFAWLRSPNDFIHTKYTYISKITAQKPIVFMKCFTLHAYRALNSDAECHLDAYPIAFHKMSITLQFCHRFSQNSVVAVAGFFSGMCKSAL